MSNEPSREDALQNTGGADTAAVDPIDEQLVAYLDGELPPEQRGELEQRLVEDAQLRRRLQQLQRGWQLLDELPQASVSDGFAQTTLEMVAADMETTPATRRSRRLGGWRLLAVALCTAAAVLIGAVVVRGSRQVALRRQLADLPLAEHLDAYLVADDLPWLTQVSQNDRWLETVDAAEAAGGFGPAGLPPANSLLSQTPVAQRAEVLEEMEPAQRSRLESAWQRFEKLSPQRQQEVRQRAAAVAAAENPERLLRTLEAYARLRTNWAVETREQIEQGSPEQRAAAFAKALEGSSRLWLRQLSDEDSEAIYRVLHVIAGDWVQRLGNERERRSGWWSGQLKSLAGDSVSGQFKEDPEAALLHFVFVRRRGWSMFQLSEDDLYAMKSVISDPVLEALDSWVPSPQEQKEVLYGWAIEAVRRKTQTARVETLQALDPADRLEVELSPPHELFPLLERKTREDRRGRLGPTGGPRPTGPSGPPGRNGRF
ncbi:hypothetical protein [Roseimaritima sediminicola]|uniref:hypothetical protein n=1 Tax=Roseimaritima sediminicola TaxID=2662066 RepID=UPI0012984A95|nr:hypothetical protein [Roseimaritima sediminicola]